MPQNKPLSLSDFIRDPDIIIEDCNNISEDDDTEYIKEYGIGIDCHSKFIEVGLLKDFLDHHVTYKQMYDEIQDKLNHKEDEINEST